jgi:two-component system KDP operon response regulator KdpE
MIVHSSSRWVAGPAVIQPLVLIVEDGRDLWLALQSVLASQGFRVVHAPTGAKVLAGAMAHEPDLVLVDASSLVVALVDLVARLRERTAAPIVAVLGEGGDREKSAVLETGIDDYVAKPFTRGDLLARMHVWLARGARSAGPRAPSASSSTGLRLDAAHRTLHVEGRQVHVTPLECRLLAALGRSSRGGYTEDELTTAVWGRVDPSLQYYLRSHVRQLRQKIERDPDRPQYLVTESTGRYRLRSR